MENSLTRFSKTVDNYVRYRPDYPMEMIHFLQNEIGLTPEQIIADIGSGTGKSTLPFLENGNPVYAVEPNLEMRAAAEKICAPYSNFKSVAASAEKTSLADKSVDVLLAGQAFHWFDKVKTRAEFLRIAKDEATIVLLWNKRNDAASDFMVAYNTFLNTYATDYTKVNLRYINEEDYRLLFGHKEWKTKQLPNQQVFDWEGLKGRYLSCSYAYHPAHAGHEEAINVLKSIFDKYQKNGYVKMVYHTELHYGRLQA